MFPFASTLELVTQEDTHVDITGKLAFEPARSHVLLIAFLDWRLLKIDKASKRNLRSHKVFAMP